MPFKLAVTEIITHHVILMERPFYRFMDVCPYMPFHVKTYTYENIKQQA